MTREDMQQIKADFVKPVNVLSRQGLTGWVSVPIPSLHVSPLNNQRTDEPQVVWKTVFDFLEVFQAMRAIS